MLNREFANAGVEIIAHGEGEANRGGNVPLLRAATRSRNSSPAITTSSSSNFKYGDADTLVSRCCSNMAPNTCPLRASITGPKIAPSEATEYLSGHSAGKPLTGTIALP